MRELWKECGSTVCSGATILKVCFGFVSKVLLDSPEFLFERLSALVAASARGVLQLTVTYANSRRPTTIEAPHTRLRTASVRRAGSSTMTANVITIRACDFLSGPI